MCLTRKVLPILGVLCSFSAIGANADSNLLEAGDFEGISSISGYWAPDTGLWGAESALLSGAANGVTPTSGSQMLQINHAGGGGVSQIHQMVEGPFIAGSQVTFEVKLNTWKSGMAVGLMIEPRSAIGSAGTPFISPNLALDSDPNTWQTLSFTHILASDTNVLAAEIRFAQGSCGTCYGIPFGYADDAVLTVTPPPDDKNFYDPLTESPNPFLNLDFSAYDFTPAGDGLERVYNNGSESHRPMNYTIASDFTSDFTARLTIEPTQAAGGDLIYFGLGTGSPNPNYHNEPTDAFLFRIHAGDFIGFANHIDTVVGMGTSSSPHSSSASLVGNWSQDTGATFEIDRSGDLITLSILDGSGNPLASNTYSFSGSALAPYLNSGNTYLFFGNTYEGTVFKDFMVVSDDSAPADYDGDGVPDDEDDYPYDFDNDGLSDNDEALHGSHPGNPDTDGDGIGDAEEVDNGTDPTKADTDGDGLSDSAEGPLGTSPINADTDGDGVSDGDEVTNNTDPLNADSDNDGLTDGQEAARGTDPKDSDSDNDGVSDGDEVTNGTNPLVEDTDGDGLSDGQENTGGTDPLNPDTDGDGLSDSADIANGTDPLNPDTDGDGVGDATDQQNQAIAGNVIIDGRDTGVADRVNAAGIALSTLETEALAACTAEANNHGAFVSCMAHFHNGLVDEGLITDEEKDALQSAAAKTGTGKAQKEESKSGKGKK